MRALGVAFVAFVIILGGGFGGASLRKVLPEHHLTDDTKDVTRLGTGLIGTIAALVLGLLIATAKGSYDSQTAGLPAKPPASLGAPDAVASPQNCNQAEHPNQNQRCRNGHCYRPHSAVGKLWPRQPF